MADRLLLIDGMYLAFASFYANPQMRTLEGLPTGAVFGFVSRTEALLRELQPGRVAAAFDSREENFRKKLYPAYKEGRQQAPEDLIAQLPDIAEYLAQRGIPRLEAPGWEADDIIASLSRRHAADGGETVIFSADKDLFQLLGPRVAVFHPKLKRLLRAEELPAFFGVQPEQVADFLTLTGDASDNVPGVAGVGEKTALKLIARFGSLDALLARMPELEEKTRRKIEAAAAEIPLWRQLLDLQRVPEAPVQVPPPFADRPGPGLAGLYRRLSFQSLLRNLEGEGSAPAIAAEDPVVPVTVVRDRAGLRRVAGRMATAAGAAIDVETTGLDAAQARLVGLSVSFAGEGYYIPLRAPEDEAGPLPGEDDLRAELGPALADPRLGKTGHNLKFDRLHLRRAGLDLNGVADDTMIMSYLLFPNRRAHHLKELTAEFLGRRQTEYRELVGKGREERPLDQVPLARVARYCVDDSALSLRLADALRPRLEEGGLLGLYRDVELPLLPVLGDMEEIGVRVDRGFLRRAGAVLGGRLAELEREVHRLAGFEFNLNSPQQLGALLFEKMNLPQGKKTRKTGTWSTDGEVLNELRGVPLVEKVIEHRAIKKLLSTYVEALLAGLDENDRVHTSFNQTVTATGRLSSSNPNLQNIPVGETAGLELRRAFVAEPGWRLLSADYSQIELRVMAHFAADPRLTEAFAAGRDIHQHTADLVFSGDVSVPARERRRRAKIVNFSIIYGSGPFSLSKELGVPVAQAKAFIDQYFATYHGVRRFIDQTIAAAQRTPEVRTLLGRVRPIPEIQSANRTVRENGQRMAVNTIIQGSAADIIKLAMIRIHRRLAGMRSRLLLQVHDELVFECPPDEEEPLAGLVRQEMEGAAALAVPLRVCVRCGASWAGMAERPPA